MRTLRSVPSLAAGAAPAPDPGDAARERGEHAYAALLAGALLLLLLWAAGRSDWGRDSPSVPYLGAMISWLGFLPAIGWSVRHHHPERTGRVPFLPVIGATYALYYGMPVLLRDEIQLEKYVSTHGSMREALWLALGGWVLLLLGWALGRRLLRGTVRPLRFELDWDRGMRAVPLLLALGACASLCLRLVDVPGALVRPMRFLETLFELGLGILVLASFRHAVSRRTRHMLALGLVPAWLFYKMGAGAVAPFAYASLFFLFLIWGAGKRVPVLSLIVLGSFVVILRGNVQEFRQETWERQTARMEVGPLERSAAFAELLVERFGTEGWDAFERATDQVVFRIAHVLELAHVVQLTPHEIPYWNGATYASLSSSLVPRFLWPDKPSKRTGQDFGHRYGLLAEDDQVTAVNLPQLVELYANFGPWGVFLGMFLFGMLYQALDRLWNTPGSGRGTLLLACLLLSRLTLIESDFSLVYGALIQEAFLLILILNVLRRRAEPGQEGHAPEAGRDPRPAAGPASGRVALRRLS